MLKICEICGTEFETNRTNKICCSKKCQVKRNCIVTEQQRKNRYYEEKQKNLIKEAMPKSNHDAIANIAIAARKEGLTYGQYVAKYMGRKA